MEILGATIEDDSIIGISVLTKNTNPVTVTHQMLQEMEDTSGKPSIDQYHFDIITRQNIIRFNSRSYLLSNSPARKSLNDYVSEQALGSFQLGYVDVYKEVIRILKERKYPYDNNVLLSDNEIPKYVFQVEEKARKMKKEADAAILNHENQRKN